MQTSNISQIEQLLTISNRYIQTALSTAELGELDYFIIKLTQLQERTLDLRHDITLMQAAQAAGRGKRDNHSNKSRFA